MPARTTPIKEAPLPSRAKGIQSVEIGFRLVRALVIARGPLPLKQIALAAEMSASKARMYLVSLMRIGMIEQDPSTGLYALGPTASELGSAALQRMDVLAEAQLAMDRLGLATGALMLLIAWSDGGATVLRQADGALRLPIDFRIGSHVSLTRTATGHVCLAYLPAAITDAHRRVEIAENLASPELRCFNNAYLDRIVKTVRANRMATLQDVRLASGIVLSGYTVISAPILDPQGKLRLVLTGLLAKRQPRMTLAATRDAIYAEAERLSGVESLAVPPRPRPADPRLT